MRQKTSTQNINSMNWERFAFIKQICDFSEFNNELEFKQRKYDRTKAEIYLGKTKRRS